MEVCGTDGAHFCSREPVQVGGDTVTSDHKQMNWVGKEHDDTVDS